MPPANSVIPYYGTAQMFQQSRSYLRILWSRRVRGSNFHYYFPQILEAILGNLVAVATWRLGFSHPWHILSLYPTICPQKPRKFTKLQLRMISHRPELHSIEQVQNTVSLFSITIVLLLVISQSSVACNTLAIWVLCCGTV